MRVAWLDPLEERLKTFPDRFLGEFEVLLTSEAGKLPDGVGGADAIVYGTYPVDRSLIERLPNLKLVQRIGYFRAAGDTSAALERGIPVAVTPWGVLNRVAQHTLTLMLALTRQLLPCYEALQEGTNRIGMEPTLAGPLPAAFNWPRIENIGSIVDKTLGIVGFGEAGACLARLVQPFDMQVLYYKRQPLSAARERYYGATYAPLDDLIRQSDFVCTFVPLREDTRGSFGAREFGLMKPSAFFVNTGRANTTDQNALLSVLEGGRIAGAGLDVYALEPLPADSALRELHNVVLTPHVAGGVGGWIDAFERIAANLRRARDGKLPIGLIDKYTPQPGRD